MSCQKRIKNSEAHAYSVQNSPQLWCSSQGSRKGVSKQ